MNSDFVADPLTTARLSLTLLHSVWQVALFAAAAWGLVRLRRRGVETSYAIHVAALLAGLTAIPITYALVRVPAIPELSPTVILAAQPKPGVVSRPEAINSISNTTRLRPPVAAPEPQMNHFRRYLRPP